MGKAGFAGLFVFRADVVPGVHRDDGSFVVFMDDDGEAVREDESGVGNVGNGDGGGFGVRRDGGFRLWRGGVGLRSGGNGVEQEGDKPEQSGAGGPRRVVHGGLPVRYTVAARILVRRKRRGMVSSYVPTGEYFSRSRTVEGTRAFSAFSFAHGPPAGRPAVVKWICNYRGAELGLSGEDAFRTLADPTRREIPGLLRHGEIYRRGVRGPVCYDQAGDVPPLQSVEGCRSNHQQKRRPADLVRVAYNRRRGFDGLGYGVGGRK